MQSSLELEAAQMTVNVNDTGALASHNELQRQRDETAAGLCWSPRWVRQRNETAAGLRAGCDSGTRPPLVSAGLRAEYVSGTRPRASAPSTNVTTRLGRDHQRTLPVDESMVSILVPRAAEHSRSAQ